MNIVRSALWRFDIASLIRPQISRTRRVVLEETKQYSVVLFQWKAQQKLPMHNHFGNCHFKVLSGEIREIRLNHDNLVYNVLKNGIEDSIKDGERHMMLPKCDSVSVHVYTPPPKYRCPTMDHEWLGK